MMTVASHLMDEEGGVVTENLPHATMISCVRETPPEYFQSVLANMIQAEQIRDERCNREMEVAGACFCILCLFLGILIFMGWP